jgi:hypothetical protein
MDKQTGTASVFSFAHAGGSGRPAAVGAEMVAWSSNTPTITPTLTPSPTITPIYLTFVVTPQPDTTQVIIGGGPDTNGNFNIVTFNYGATSAYGHTVAGASDVSHIIYSSAFNPLTDPFHWNITDNKGGYSVDQIYVFPTVTPTPTITLTVTPTPTPTNTPLPTATETPAALSQTRRRGHS